MSKRNKRYFNSKKVHLLLLALAVIMIGSVLIVPAFWSGYDYKKQLVFQDYSPELKTHINRFVENEKSNQQTVNSLLIARWDGAGKAYLTANLPLMTYQPELLFGTKRWFMKWVGLNTFAIDANLNVQWLRLQLKRKNIVQWRVDGICFLDIDEASEPCIFPDEH